MQVQTTKQFLEYWDGLRGRTRRVVACIPPPPDSSGVIARAPSRSAISSGTWQASSAICTLKRWPDGPVVTPAAGVISPMDTMPSCVLRPSRHRSQGDLRGADRCRPRAQVPDPGWHLHHDLEVVASHVRARGASSRSDLPDAQHAPGAHAAAVRIDRRGGSGSRGSGQLARIVRERPRRGT